MYVLKYNQLVTIQCFFLKKQGPGSHFVNLEVYDANVALGVRI